MTAAKLLSHDLPLFDGLSEDDLAGIELTFRSKKFAAGERVVEQGEDTQDVRFLISGSLLAVFLTDQGREIVYSRFPVGAYFGELAAFDGAARSLTVTAMEKSKVLIMKRDSFLALFDAIPAVRRRIAHGMAQRIRSLTARNMEMATLSVKERVRTYIARLAIEQGKLAAGAFIENAPTHAEIAGSIGANREMVSRSMSKLAKRSIIRSARQKIEIVDPDALLKAKI